MWKRIEENTISHMIANTCDRDSFNVIFASCSNQEPLLRGNNVHGDRIEDTGDGNIALFSENYTLVIPKPRCLSLYCSGGINPLNKWPELLDIRYMCLTYHPESEGGRLTGIESYHNLEVFWTDENCPARVRDLVGIEYCSRLRYLGLGYQLIQDLTPLEGLPIISLFIVNNPITTLEPVDQISLEDLAISSNMVHLLLDRVFVSLKNLSIQCYDEDFNPPTEGEDPRYDIDSLTCASDIQEFRKRHPHCIIQICQGRATYRVWWRKVWCLPGRSVQLNETSVYAKGEVSLSTR